jgi:hypothetical protein
MFQVARYDLGQARMRLGLVAVHGARFSLHQK